LKNYVELWAIDGFDGGGGYIVFGGGTAAEVQTRWDDYHAAIPGSTFKSGPNRVYWLLNKNVLAGVFATVATVLDPMHSSAFTQDDKIAQKYNVNSANWGGTDLTDENAVRALKIAQVVLKIDNRFTRSGHETITEALFLTLLYQTLLTEHQFSLANKVFSILKDLQLKKITPLQAQQKTALLKIKT